MKEPLLKKVELSSLISALIEIQRMGALYVDIDIIQGQERDNIVFFVRDECIEEPPSDISDLSINEIV